MPSIGVIGATQSSEFPEKAGNHASSSEATSRGDEKAFQNGNQSAQIPEMKSIQPQHIELITIDSAVPLSKEFKATAIPTFNYLSSMPGGPHSRAEAKVTAYADAPSPKQFPRISRPVELIRTTYDVVVIGSGYGGGVAASRMARGGQSVCLLERGKEKWPGEYPSNIEDAARELHISGYAAPWNTQGKLVEGGNPTGLYHLVVGQGQNAFVGNGLGGTSLLNANIFLRADEKTLATDSWPSQIRPPGALEMYYERAASVLEPTPYPTDFPELPKLTTLKKQADALGFSNKFYRPPQTTRFVDGPNSTGVEMRASSLTGEDSTGLNDGSKSSTLVNYLSDAWNWGAEMFCECEVRYVKKHPSEGYLVLFAWHGSHRGVFKDNLYEDLMWVHAKKCLFLGAGALGTTEILLRSKMQGLPLSSKVGTDMSGNGDILAFGYDLNDTCDAMGKEFPSPERPIGPTITGVIDCRDQLNPLDGFVIEEGAVPGSLAGFLQTLLETSPGQIAPKNVGFVERAKHLLARQGSRLLGPYFPRGSVEKTQIFLIMSHDSNQAIMTLHDDKPELKFLGVGRSDRVQELNNILAQATNAVGGTYVNSPFFASLGQQEITVHAIGGAVMSRDGTPREGVTNSFGQVFTGHGNDVYDGLVVVDGAIVPTALGVNPFATITALAERSVERVAEEHGISIDYRTKNGLLNLFGKPAHPVQQSSDVSAEEAVITLAQAAGSEEISFTETMSGYLNIASDIEDYNAAFSAARGLSESAQLFLSVKSWNVNTIMAPGDHKAMLTGSVSCALPGSPFMVNQGSVHLFNEDSGTADTRSMIYEFDMVSIAGRKIRFRGHTIIDTAVAFDTRAFWKATTSLYVSLTEGTDNKLVGCGIMYRQPKDLLSECRSFQAGGSGIVSKVKTTAKLLSYATKLSLELFLTPLSFLQWPSPSYNGFITNTEISKTLKIKASDGVTSILNMWEAIPTSTNAPTILFIPGAALDHQIFALPTIEVNAIDYFRSAGYQIYTVTHRCGKNMEAEKGGTSFDARLDVLAALQYIRMQHGNSSVYVVAEGAGSIALSSGLLDGSINPGWVAGITASNVFMNPSLFVTDLIKDYAWPVPLDTLYKITIGNWYSCISTQQDSYIQRFIDQALRFYPVGMRSQLCRSVVCHRCSLVFGLLFNHRNLNEATHSQLNRFVGGVSMNWLHHALAIGRKGRVTTNFPLATDLVTMENVARLKGIPILFFSGSENQVFTPDCTDTSYSKLRRQLGDSEELYERVVFQGYGHLDCWIGKDAHRDVFPTVKTHIDSVMGMQ